jgi:hypothetical protein
MNKISRGKKNLYIERVVKIIDIFLRGYIYIVDIIYF